MSRGDLLALGVHDVEVWGRTIDTQTFSPEKRDFFFRRSNGWEEKFVFLHVGRLAAEKGVDRILQAFRIARDQLPARSIHLIVAGGGPEEADLRRVAPPEVTFLGVLDHKYALPQLYASADAFVFASLTETLGLVILEAMSSGLPVIATPAGGVADHLRDGENGLTFPPYDTTLMAHAMVSVAMDSTLRDELARGARVTAEGLDWDAELDRLDESYREVIERFTRANETEEHAELVKTA
jgi:phosphatidylinositol alpha 1,6-mannosyltransferase